MNDSGHAKKCSRQTLRLSISDFMVYKLGSVRLRIESEM